jgi:hypothetical protein
VGDSPVVLPGYSSLYTRPLEFIQRIAIKRQVLINALNPVNDAMPDFSM